MSKAAIAVGARCAQCTQWTTSLPDGVASASSAKSIASLENKDAPLPLGRQWRLQPPMTQRRRLTWLVDWPAERTLINAECRSASLVRGRAYVLLACSSSPTVNKPSGGE